MAANEGTLSTSTGLLTTTSPKTLLQLVAPANQALRVKGFGIGFKGIVVTDTPIVVELLRQTTPGTGTARGPVKRSLGGPSLQATGFENFTVEPTAGDTVWVDTIHPQASGEFPLIGREVIVDGGGRLGLRVTASVSVSGHGHIDFEE